MGQKRTAELITRGFYWPNMHSDIAEFVRTCHSCQINKSSGLREALLSPIAIPHSCWRVVGIDAITQLPRTPKGKDCLLVFVDHFSKAVRLVPTTCALDAVGFARKFMKHVYPHYGLPLGLVSDRGSQWNSALFRGMCDDLGIDLKLTFSYHPQANGQVERYNRVIEEAVRHFVGPAMDDWDRFIPHLEFSLNNSVVSATGCTPFSLNRLTPPLSLSSLAFGLISNNVVSLQLLNIAYVSFWRSRLWPKLSSVCISR
jgi:hypothetical protein